MVVAAAAAAAAAARQASWSHIVPACQIDGVTNRSAVLKTVFSKVYIYLVLLEFVTRALLLRGDVDLGERRLPSPLLLLDGCVWLPTAAGAGMRSEGVRGGNRSLGLTGGTIT